MPFLRRPSWNARKAPHQESGRAESQRAHVQALGRIEDRPLRNVRNDWSGLEAVAKGNFGNENPSVGGSSPLLPRLKRGRPRTRVSRFQNGRTSYPECRVLAAVFIDACLRAAKALRTKPTADCAAGPSIGTRYSGVTNPRSLA